MNYRLHRRVVLIGVVLIGLLVFTAPIFNAIGAPDAESSAILLAGAVAVLTIIYGWWTL